MMFRFVTTYLSIEACKNDMIRYANMLQVEVAPSLMDEMLCLGINHFEQSHQCRSHIVRGMIKQSSLFSENVDRRIKIVEILKKSQVYGFQNRRVKIKIMMGSKSAKWW